MKKKIEVSTIKSSELIANDDTPMTINTIAKDYGLSSIELTDLLLALKILKKNNDELCKYVISDKSLGTLDAFDINLKRYVTTGSRTDYVRFTPKFNKLGRLKINESLNSIGIHTLNDRILSQPCKTNNYDLSLIRRNNNTIFIGYTKNMNKDDVPGLNYLPISKETVEKIKPLMKDSARQLEDISKGYKKVGPRIDTRDLDKFNIISSYMDKNFLAKFNIEECLKVFGKENKDIAKRYI